MASARRCLTHEEQVKRIFGGHLEEVVRDICDVLLEGPTALRQELLEAAHQAVPLQAIQEAAEAYRRSCRGSQAGLEGLLPLGTLYCLVRHQGAFMRSSLQRAARAISSGSSGSQFLELLERHLVACGELEAHELHLELKAHGSGARSTSEPLERSQQERQGRAAMYTNFLPHIDHQRLLHRELEELKQEVLPGHLYLVPWRRASHLALDAFVLHSFS